MIRWRAPGVLNLRGTSVGGIDDDERSWPRRVYLTGFTYGQPTGDTVSTGGGLAERNIDWYRGWLEGDEIYSRQPYRQLELTLRSVGRNSEANAIAIMSKDREREGEPALQQASSWVHKLTVGYGYRPHYAGIFALVLIVVGTFFAGRVPSSSAAPSRLILSMQRLIPLVSFGEAYSKVDTTSTAVPRGVRWYFYIHSILGYILAAFLLAALTRVTTT